MKYSKNKWSAIWNWEGVCMQIVGLRPSFKWYPSFKVIKFTVWKYIFDRIFSSLHYTICHIVNVVDTKLRSSELPSPFPSMTGTREMMNILYIFLNNQNNEGGKMPNLDFHNLDTRRQILFRITSGPSKSWQTPNTAKQQSRMSKVHSIHSERDHSSVQDIWK